MSNNKTILIVDDDPDILEALQLIFESVGFTVRTTPKGEETFALVQRFHPDAIMLDVLLSGVDGREICKALKADEATKRIPVIMISAHPVAHISTIAAGADKFVSKPFDMHTLIQTVELLVV